MIIYFLLIILKHSMATGVNDVYKAYDNVYIDKLKDMFMLIKDANRDLFVATINEYQKCNDWEVTA